MIDDWRQEIAIAWLVKQALMELDKGGLLPHCLPEVAASEDQLLQAEKHLGHKLDGRYQQFLKHANGWKGFLQTTDLFGTDDLIGGERHDYGEFVLSCLDDDLLGKNNISREDIFPIAASKFDRDLFVMTRPSCAPSGVVIWLSGGEVERYGNFDEYFLAMVDYNRHLVQKFRDEAKGF